MTLQAGSSNGTLPLRDGHYCKKFVASAVMHGGGLWSLRASSLIFFLLKYLNLINGDEHLMVHGYLFTESYRRPIYTVFQKTMPLNKYTVG